MKIQKEMRNWKMRDERERIKKKMRRGNKRKEDGRERQKK